jgi:hypothetical protein
MQRHRWPVEGMRSFCGLCNLPPSIDFERCHSALAGDLPRLASSGCSRIGNWMLWE